MWGIFVKRFPRTNAREYKKCAKLSPIADKFNYYNKFREVADFNEPTGLFGNNRLINCHGFANLSEETIIRCKELLNEALSQNRCRKIVKVLDDISDSLCRVADLADCVRMLHPSEEFRSAAASACETIGHLVEELNTNTELYAASVQATKPKNQRIRADSDVDSVDQRVLELFVSDFELSGVQLLDTRRHAEFVRNAAIALKIGAEFIEACHKPVLFPPKEFVNKPEYNLSQMGPGYLTQPITDHPDASVRLASYLSYYSPLDNQEERLQRLLEARRHMAEAAGFDSYAKRATLHSLAENPENVEQFLHHVCTRLRPIASRTVRTQLLPVIQNQVKMDNADTKFDSHIYPWDLPFALGIRRHCVNSSSLEDYFSLGACMEGIRMLADCLFNLKLTVEPVQPGEVWHPSVIKVGVESRNCSTSRTYKTFEHIGTVYCDLIDRPDKPAQDCHYTIRGGRCLDDSSYQSPIITLQLTLSPPSNPNTPPLLSLGQVENLFHEWGHALHSMLARTRYQHVTGTRCSTDLAELPSTLFEHFALDPRVTSEYARHWKTGQKPDQSELKALYRLSVSRNLGQSVEVSQQVSYALFDQSLHSSNPEEMLGRNLKMTKVSQWPASAKLLSEVQNSCGLSDWFHCHVNYLGAWPHRFSHLVNYGGRYYAYLMARAGADLVWRRCFAQDPWSSSQGQRYMKTLLCHGGEYHPAVMLSNLLSDSNMEDTAARDESSLLSPLKLADGLVDQIEENEADVAQIINRIDSPGLFSPRLNN